MRTRSQARRRRQPQVRQTSVESSNLEKPDNPPIVTMADNRTMAQLLEAPTEGYEDAIVIPEITANNFEIKHGLLNLVQNKQFFGNDKEDPHAHILSLNSAAGGNFLGQNARECLKIHRGYMSKSKQFSIEEINFNQNRGKQFQPRVQIYRPPVHQPVVNQPVAHQGPAPQTHGVSKTDFERYVTANDAVLRNMQNQGQNLQSQMANLTDMLSKFVTANTASTSGSGTLPGNTITNPKEDLKVNHDAEVTKDTMPPANNGSTEDVQPPVVQIQTRNPNPEPNVAPDVAPIPKASIPFPSRRNDEKRKEKANDQNEKFYEIFRDLSFEISFTDALMLMPKFASTLKTLIGNKEKLS
ncbi:hypothetical protein Tco_0212568 [Tanacetum coccineum]